MSPSFIRLFIFQVLVACFMHIDGAFVVASSSSSSSSSSSFGLLKSFFTQSSTTTTTTTTTTRTTTNNKWSSNILKLRQRYDRQEKQQLSFSRPSYVLEKLQRNNVTTTTTITTTRNDANYTSDNNTNRESSIKQYNDNNDHDDEDKDTIYYFGIGSNMLRSKIENRGVNGTKIELLDIEPAYVQNYRLAFNMKGFPPLESGMGAIEPIYSSSKPIYSYDKPECHGALVKVTMKNYEEIMKSEGINTSSTTNNTQNRGYEEVIVTAIPYNTSRKAVLAIALRAKPGSRLLYDAYPSKRYMNILREGATELGLLNTYQQYLYNHPIQNITKLMKHIAIYNLIGTFTLSSIIKTRILSQIQSFLLFQVYYRSNISTIRPSVVNRFQHWISEVLMGMILLPGYIIGYLYRNVYLKHIKKDSTLPFMMQRFVTMLDDTTEQKIDENNQTITTTTTTTTS